MWQSWLKRPEDETTAARVGMSNNLYVQARYALWAGLAFAIDPNDTRQINYLTLAVDIRNLRRLMERVSGDPSWQRLIRERAAIDTKQVDFAHLRALPPDTLGGAYVRMLDRNGLDPDFFQPPPEWPEDVGYALQRLRQTHDLMHVLTGFETDIPGEVALQAFIRVQLGTLFSTLVVVFGLLLYSPRYPRMWPMVLDGHRAAVQADTLFPVRWEDYWEMPLAEVRKRFGIANLEHWGTRHASVVPQLKAFAKRWLGAETAEAA